MQSSKLDGKRCVQLTDTGLKRLHEARRRYQKTMENIAFDANTPSLNTIKRAFRQGPVFVDTLERIWDFLRGCARAQKETLPDLDYGTDYVFEGEIAGAAGASNMPSPPPPAGPPGETDSRRGWLSRQVPRPNRLFFGRRAVLDELHHALKTGPAALVSDAVIPGAPLPDPQALTGLGGIGKTQTAIAYVYERRRDYDGVFWLTAKTVEDIQDGLAGLARELNLLETPSASREQALTAMYDWFQTRSGWLLVLDNADDLHTLAPHFPRHHTGSLLLTTRTRSTTLWAAPVELVTFTPAEGAVLLLRRAGLLGLSQTLEEIADPLRGEAEALSAVLGGLPLALDQAGAYLAETRIPLAQYAERYRVLGIGLLDQFPDPSHVPVRVTYELSVQQVTRRGKYGEAAVEMLRLCAFLAPDRIPEAIFASYPFPQDGIATPAIPFVPDPAYYAEVSAVVCGYSLVRRDPDAGTVSLHSLVQKVIAETLGPDAQRDWKARTVAAVAGASPDFEFEDWRLCDQFLPHWRLCAAYIAEHGIETPEAAYLLHQAGRYVRARALYPEALAFLSASLAIARGVYGEQHRVTADALDTLACLYRDLDRTDEAEVLHQRAVAVSSAVAGPDHPETAGKLHNLGLLYAEQKAFDQAETCFVRALAIREAELSDSHPGVATTLTQLAGVYRGQKRYAEAEESYRRALAIYEKTLGPDHVDLATGYNNLALFYVTTQQYAEAEPLYLLSLQINEATRGPAHPETGTVLWGLAIVQWKRGRPGEAEATFRRALAVYSAHYHDDHSRLVRLRQYYADFCADFQESR